MGGSKSKMKSPSTTADSATNGNGVHKPTKAEIKAAKLAAKAAEKEEKLQAKREEQEMKQRQRQESKEEKLARKNSSSAAREDGGSVGSGRKASVSSSSSNKNVFYVAKEDEEESAFVGKKSSVDRTPTRVKSRLSVDLSKNAAFADEEKEAKKPGRKASKLFEAPKGPQHSKIYKALNPDKLYYESRREKDENAKDKNKVEVGQRNYAGMFRDEDGNVVDGGEEEEEEEEEEDYDPNNLPDFGELQKEMDALRAERAKKEEERRLKLKEEFQKKKAAEKAALDAEVAAIKEREAKLKRIQTMDPTFVKNAQKRLDQEAQQYLKFTFQTD